MQALCQALIPFATLGYAPGTAATDSVAAAAQAQAELSCSSALQLLWTLAYLQALPGKTWTALMSRMMELLQPFADLAGEGVWLSDTASLSGSVNPLQDGHPMLYHQRTGPACAQVGLRLLAEVRLYMQTLARLASPSSISPPVVLLPVQMRP